MLKDEPSAIIIILVVLNLIVGSVVLTGKTTDIFVSNYNGTTSNQTVTREEVVKKSELTKEAQAKEEKQKVEEIENPMVEELVDAAVATPEPTVYDGLTMKGLSEKLERNLNSNLKGYGHLFASYSLELGIDPYLALAITLHETGCKWNCSTLVKQCNNVGGMKGSPGCNGGSYKAFATLEQGIRSYLENLYYNYYRYGLKTPEAMNSKYAESKTWANQVNHYLNQVRAS